MMDQSRWRALLQVRRVRFWVYLVSLVAAIVLLSRGNPAFIAGIVIFVIGLLSSVMLHELGHFVTAKKFGMKVTQFFIGFGKTIWSTFRGETEYGVKVLPFGGFVRITGMTSAEEIDVADEPRSFRNHPGWQRMIVLAAGSFMHFLFALVLLFVLAATIGLPNSNSTTIGLVAKCVPNSVHALDNDSCHNSLGTSPAKIAGLRPNDKIIAIGGIKTANWSQLESALKAQKAGVPTTVEVLRNGKDVVLHVKLAHVPGRSRAYLGVDAAVVFQRDSPISAVSYAGSQFGSTVSESVTAVAKLPAAIPYLFSKNRAHTPAGQISSTYGVAAITGDVAESNLGWQIKVSIFIGLLASVNIFVGIFNMLPLLPMDGGHLAIVIFERIRAWFARLRGRPDPGLVDMQKLIPVSMLFFAVLVGLGTLLIAADIFNPVHIQL
jgi:membrane-associated protease RseP (regulator of RpoE activity)